MSWLHVAVVIPFLFAWIVPLLYKAIPRIHTGWFVSIVPLSLFLFFIRYVPNLFQANTLPITETMTWIPRANIHLSLYVDGLGLLFALIITGIGFLVVLYSIYYMSKERESLHNFYVYLLLFMGAMLGIVFSDNILVLYAFWELTSVSSFLLIAYWYERKRSRQGAQKSLLITVFGGFAMLAAFLLLYVMTGTYSIREMIASVDQIHNHVLFIPAMLLLLLGAFTKSAQFPFHIWLPDAMEAPTPISAYLHSATMVKAGIYLIARFTPIFGGHIEWSVIVTTVGLLTLFWGSFMAVKQTDLKALLAFSTVSQLGLIISLLGVGSNALHAGYSEQSVLFTGAILAAMFHLINHSTFKGCLFMVIGILDHETGTRDIRRLGGIMSIMPISFTLAVIGSMSMAGLPPFSGFLSKEMFFTGMLTASRTFGVWASIVPIVAWIASIFTFIYSMIIIFKTFTGPFKPELLDREPKEAPIGMLIPPIVLAALVVILFFFPNVLSQTILEPTVRAIVPQLIASGESFAVHIKPWHGFNMELLMTLGVVAFGTLLYVSLHRWSVSVYESFPERFSLNHAYDLGLDWMERFSSRTTNLYMTGFVRDYLVYIFLFLIVVCGGGLIGLHSINWSSRAMNAPIHFYEALLVIIMILSAVSVLFARSRITAIIAVGAVGYLMALFFVIFRAPDLALTQLVVETISTALYLLCFYYYPKLKKELVRLRFRLTNALIALGVGTTLTLFSLAAQGHRLFEPISDYFEDSETLAGARNMVNAILVDFRAFDTMLEIVVLFTAGLGVYTLIRLRRSNGGMSE